MGKLTFNRRYDFIRSLVTGGRFNPRASGDPKGVHLARDPEASPTFKMRWSGRRKSSRDRWRNSTFGLAYAEPRRRKDWVKSADLRESHLRHKRRRKGKHPLTRIAEQLPMKLPKAI
jgi:hypothetical protein